MDRWRTTELPPASIEPRDCEHCEAPIQGWWVTPLRGDPLWVWGTCACREVDAVREHFDGARDRPDNSLVDPPSEPHDLEGRC